MQITVHNVKTVVHHVVGLSTYSIVSRIIASHSLPQTKLQKAEATVAGAAIGGMVSKQTAEYVDRFIDDTVAAWNKAKSEN